MVERDIAGAIYSPLASGHKGRGTSLGQIHVHKSHSLATHTYVQRGRGREGKRERGEEGERENLLHNFFNSHGILLRIV